MSPIAPKTALRRMNYCARCIVPDTRPNISFDTEGVCNACRAHESRPKIDWASRKAAFEEIVRTAKVRSKGYDCLIPVSGGKDSTWQTIKCLEAGLNPLAVTWKTPSRTPLGVKNLENLVSLGVDHIDYQINPKVERTFLYESFKRFGTTTIPMHMAIFNIPLQIAIRYEIPLVVWGENSATEYGGTDDEIHGFKLDGRWMKKYGNTFNTFAEDWVSPGLSAKQLTPYFGPDEKTLERAGVLAAFLGYYFPWDPDETYRVAKAHGFTADTDGPKTGYYNYADIDDNFVSIHHWLKWHKFGFTRLYDNLSLEIRNGRLTREQTIAIVREKGDQTPHGDIEKFCAFLGMDKKEFFEIAESFRSHDLWSKENGHWRLDGFLVPDWKWS